MPVDRPRTLIAPSDTRRVTVVIGTMLLGLVRSVWYVVWIGLTALTPILTTVLTAVALLGVGVILFFRFLLHAPSFPTLTILVLSLLSLLCAAVLNWLVVWLRPP